MGSRVSEIHRWYTSLPEQELTQLVSDVDRAVHNVAPAFAEQASRTPNRATVTSVVEMAFTAFVSYMDNPDVAADSIFGTFTRIGYQMAVDGVELETMQRVLEEASSLIVDRIELLLELHPMRAPLAVHLTQMVSKYLARLREAVREGFTPAPSSEVGSRRDRSDLFDLLSGGASAEDIEKFAARSALAVPRRVAAVTVGGTLRPLRRLAPLDERGLLPASGPVTVILVAEEDLDSVDGIDGVDAAAAQLPPMVRLAVGPLVPAEHAAESIAVARAAQRHLDSGALPREDVFRCDQHLVELLLLSDHISLSALAERRLSPLAAIPPRDREQYAVALLALLETGKSVRQLAHELHYHQQTLQSRVNKLKALYGDQLEDPGARVEIILALRHALQSPADVLGTEAT
ncbi:MAG: helix-turn-helix domain-containing protein [Lapillicoccus sp.]